MKRKRGQSRVRGHMATQMGAIDPTYNPVVAAATAFQSLSWSTRDSLEASLLLL